MRKIFVEKQKVRATSSRTNKSNPRRSPGRTINIFHEIHRRRQRIQTALNQAIIGVTSKYYNQGIRSRIEIVKDIGCCFPNGLLREGCLVIKRELALLSLLFIKYVV